MITQEVTWIRRLRLVCHLNSKELLKGGVLTPKVLRESGEPFFFAILTEIDFLFELFVVI